MNEHKRVNFITIKKRTNRQKEKKERKKEKKKKERKKEMKSNNNSNKILRILKAYPLLWNSLYIRNLYPGNYANESTKQF